MCNYYAYRHLCGHTRMVFAAFCNSAAFLQNPCGRGNIWVTVEMEGNCSTCKMKSDLALSRNQDKSPKRKIGKAREQ
ncbi:hypothetical protein M433DRAFT_493226 [Acidomyces richmondensis BFW]|nr:hypothetical protein M433DRAFT_493226 [Acidomyces richmondensis BFW]